MCTNIYAKAIKESAERLKYNVKLITLNQKDRDYSSVLTQVDAIISPGGHDIEPKYYTQLLSQEDAKRVEVSFKKYGTTDTKGKYRDAFEFGLFKEYLENDKYKNLPVLGICYGMQMLAAVNKIPLYVDILTDINLSSRRKIYDTIVVKEESNLAQYIGNSEIKGYKNHHQAIHLKYFNDLQKKGFFSNVLITGVSNKGKIVEVIEFQNRPSMGVQFHPEKSSEKIRRSVFSSFLVNACKNKRRSMIEYR